MLLSIALIIFSGLILGFFCKQMHLPALVGMIIAGILIGPNGLGLLDESILNCSAAIRKIALIIILLRAGITLQMSDLKKMGRPAILMCFLPACFEIVGMIILAPIFLGVTRLEAAIMGAVVGAVSPAVIVPRMISLIEKKEGTAKGIPQLVLAGASVDDVFVIVLFTAFTGKATGDGSSLLSFVNVPVSIICGIGVGILVGILLSLYFTKFHVRDTVKLMVLLGLAMLLCVGEDALTERIPFAFSALLSIMTMGMVIKMKKGETAARLSVRLNKIWVLAEIFLFVLVGALVKVENAADYGIEALLLVLAVLVFRALGVFLCVLKTKLNGKEKLFCIFAYLPKATVQAAIGGIPLAMGLACGDMVLTVSVLAILITAPLGAILIDSLHKKLLQKDME